MPRVVHNILIFLQNKKFMNRKQAGKSLQEWQKSSSLSSGQVVDTWEARSDSAGSNEGREETVIVEGLLLEDCGDDGFVQRWCVVTKDSFHICTCKGAPPSLAIPFELVAEARPDGSDTILELSRRYSTANIATTEQQLRDGMTALRSDLLTPSVVRKSHLMRYVLPREKSILLATALHGWKDLVHESSIAFQSSTSLQGSGPERSHSSEGRRANNQSPEAFIAETDDASDDSSVTDLFDNGSFVLVTKASRFKPPQERKFISSNSHVMSWWLEGINTAMEHQKSQPPLSSFQLLRKSVAMTYRSDAFQVRWLP